MKRRLAFGMMVPMVAVVAATVPTGSTPTALSQIAFAPLAGPACGAGAPVARTYDIAAINVKIPFSRWLGDLDPHGMVYVLQADKAAMKNWFEPLPGFPGAPASEPAAGRRLRPRPLVIRANVGECIAINFTNELDELTAPRADGLPVSPRASIHVDGPSYNPGTSAGANVGFNADTTVGHLESITYHWRVPMDEGIFLFRDMANTAGGEADGGTLARGLFGGLVVEPAGSRYYDPVSGAELYTGATDTQSGELYINAVIVPGGAGAPASYDGSIPAIHAPDSVIFRESVQIAQDEIPEIGLGFNYGVENLLQRQEPINRCADCVGEETWLSSWPFGDPGLVKLASGLGPWYPVWHPLFPGNAGLQRPDLVGVTDPEDCGLTDGCYTANVQHAYPFDPIKFRFAHAGPKETHVFHMHAHQWLMEPDDVGNSGSTPGQPGVGTVDGTADTFRMPEALTIDSQTFGPGEGFTADLLFGGGSKPGTVGDTIFHCHLYPHFAEGFWSLLRVHDMLEDGSGLTPDGHKVRALLPLLDRSDPPDAPDELRPGFPRFVPGTYAWRAPQPLNGAWELNATPDDPASVTREDLSLATRHVAGVGLDSAILLATQVVSLTATGGDFTLTFGGETTAPIPFGADAATVEGALELLPSLMGATVTGSPGSWIVRLDLWTKGLSPPPLLELTVDGAGLTGVTVPATVSVGAGLPAWFTSSVFADVAYKLAIERWQSLTRYNPGIDVTDNPTAAIQPKPGAPLVDPCPAGAREITYNVSIIQTDVVYNEAGWHDTQARFLVLDEHVDAVLDGSMEPEPLFFRANAGDCINFNLTNRMPNWLGNDDFLELIQTNMVGQHIHLVKFDVTASDGASNGWNNQQAAYSEGQVAFSEAVLAGTQDCIPDTFIGLALDVDGCRIPTPDPSTIDPAFLCTGATCPVGQTFRERWYADYELRTVFSHDHHFPAEDQNRGYFSALIVEPAGFDTRDPFTGEFFQPINQAANGPLCGAECNANAVGTQRDIIGPGPDDDFRELSLATQDFVSLYRPCTVDCDPSEIGGQEPINPPDAPELYPDDDPGVFGVNMRNAPFSLRDTKLGVPVDPAYTFSSWVWGDPETPVFELYSDDRVVVRAIQGAMEEQHFLSFHGMRWRNEPDDPESPLVNGRAMGISDAFTFDTKAPHIECVVGQPCIADYLYSTTTTDDLYLGLWGLVRVYGKDKPGVLRLPDDARTLLPAVTVPAPTGEPPPLRVETGDVCPPGVPTRNFDIVAMETDIVYNEGGYHDPYGLIYALASDEADIRSGAKLPEPLTIRANEGECIGVTLENKLTTAFLDHDGVADGDPILPTESPTGTPAGLRVSLHPSIVQYDVRFSDGATIGFNLDQTVGPGEVIHYEWYADPVSPGEIGPVNLLDFGDVRGHRHHGLFAGLIIEPADASYHDPITGAQIESGIAADIRTAAGNFREFPVYFQDGLNLRLPGVDLTPVPDPLDDGELMDAEDQGEKGFNYRNANYNVRLGIPPGPLDDLLNTDQSNIFSSTVHGDPMTPIFQAYPGDDMRIRVMMGADKPRQHSIAVGGHSWRRDPYDPGSQIIGAQSGITVGRAVDIFAPAGGDEEQVGDFIYNCRVLAHHISGGLWGILRVLPKPAGPDVVPADQPLLLETPVGDVTVNVELQGRVGPNLAGTSVTVESCPTSPLPNFGPFNPPDLTDGAGVALVTSFLDTCYSATASHPGYLSSALTVGAPGPTLPTVVLRGGDVNGDGTINIVDLSALLTDYLGPQVNGSTDINGSGTVDIVDFSILLSNYGVSGPTSWP